MDAFTYTHVDKKTSTMRMFLVLLTDRLFVKSGSEGFVRALTALAHELYGNVTRHLHESIDDFSAADAPTRRATEIESFKLSIEFLDNFMASPEFMSFPIFVRDEFPKQRAREERALQWWQNTGSCSFL
jgi:hypothetical protein